MIFSSKIFHQQYFHENFHKHFSWKLFASKFSLRFFFRIFFRIAGHEFSPGSNGGTPRLQIDLGKKIQTIFDSRLSGSGKTPALSRKRRTDRISQIFEISALVGNPSPTSTNILFFPPNHSLPIVIWLPAWFCVRYVSHSWQKPSVIFFQWRLRHLCFVWYASQKTVHTIAT